MAGRGILFDLMESPITIALAILGITLSLTFCQLFLHRLSPFPGPFLAKISDIPVTLACRRASRSAWVAKQHDLYGPVVRIAPNHISINKPEAVGQIYGHKMGFTKGRFYQAFHQVEPVLFNTTDLSIHQRKKKYISPAFSARNLQEFEPHMNPNIATLAAHCQEVAKRSRMMDFCKWSNFLAFDIIGSYSFGTPFGFLESGKDDLNLIHVVDTRGEVLNALGHLPLWLRPYMRYFVFDPFWHRGLSATSALAAIGSAAEAKRRSESTSRKDLMSFLLNAKDPETGAPLPRSEVVAEAISFIVGGSDTTSSTMTNFMDFVSRQSDLQDRIYRELVEAFPGPLLDDWVAAENVAGKLPFLNATLKEVMRLRPTSSTGLERVVPVGGRTVAGVYLPGGSLVSVPTMMLHHNQDIYNMPKLFMPQRWLESNASELRDYFIPFSMGPRACVGRSFAWMEMLKTLATLFRRFEFRRSRVTESDLREGFFVKVSECEVFVVCRE
ncbi:cytochrome P450 [Rhexocercosporidium sp. MPI-PUGE-AT-0058]|nr:cytochrome P450 [Rhexocercosporidium sp. MPI-PUGE-AT-0058]